MTGSRRNRLFFILLWALLLLTGLSLSGVTNAIAAQFIAGVEPDKRRADIPVISKTTKDAAWQKGALTGVSEPYPEHVLQFLDDQGNWFSPFLHPGMVDRYDLRGWHKSKKE